MTGSIEHPPDSFISFLCTINNTKRLMAQHTAQHTARPYNHERWAASFSNSAQSSNPVGYPFFERNFVID
jgi:hypothetical protein